MAVEATHPIPNQSSVPSFQWANAQQIPFSGIQSSTMLPPNLTLDANQNVQRKRSRDFLNHFNPPPSFLETNVDSSQFSSFFTDVMPQIQHQQFEIDSIISQHTKKMRLDLQEKQKQNAMVIATAIGEKATAKMKEKDEQILKMGKLNWALQERVKCLVMENQLWRDLAQNNEAQARSLRADLDQAMAHVEAAQAQPDDVESCCGSNGADVSGVDWKKCRRCGERESSVLVLPCRHMCLCDTCVSRASVQVCPACGCGLSGTLHVNVSH